MDWPPQDCFHYCAPLGINSRQCRLDFPAGLVGCFVGFRKYAEIWGLDGKGVGGAMVLLHPYSGRQGFAGAEDAAGKWLCGTVFPVPTVGRG